MNVSTLLDQAALCKTEEDAAKLLEVLREAFAQTAPLPQLNENNAQSFMEDDNPFANFELNRVISEYYLTRILPWIRERKLIVLVTTFHLNDGLGLESKDWGVAKGFKEEVITADPVQTVEQLAVGAKALAIADHARLIEQAGVPSALARETAEASW
jgi:hypothetical protein